MIKNFYLALKLLWQETKQGEWLIVLLALIIAVTTLTSIGFYTDRVSKGLQQQTIKLLGGNLVLNSSIPIDKKFSEKAKNLGLKTAELWVYPTMINFKGKIQIINLEAVSNEFPLIDKNLGKPSINTAWIDERLFSQLGMNLNETIKIGSASFKVTKILKGQVDLINRSWLIAPIVLIRLEDVTKTQTVLNGSRVEYRLLVVGNNKNLETFKQWTSTQLTPSQKLIDSYSSQSILREGLGRTENYLQLVILICLTLCGVAIAVSLQEYLRRHFSHIALWRTLGATENQILILFIWQFIIVGFFACIIGVTSGFILHYSFVSLFKDLLSVYLPPAGWWPVLLGVLTSLFLLFSFSVPLLRQLPRISPLQLWRKNLSFGELGNSYLFIAVIVIAVFLYIFLNHSNLVIVFMDLLIVCLGILFLFSMGILFLIKKIAILTNGTLKRGLGQLLQYSTAFSLQYVGLTLVLSFIIVLFLVRTNIISEWHNSLPPKTPNYFIINIAPYDLNNLKNFFIKNKIFVSDYYPIVRGRLIGLNGHPIFSVIPEASRNHNILHRELNLSWMNHFPDDNKIVLGLPWNEVNNSSIAFVSVEKNIGETFNFKLGDELIFQIGDQKISAKIANFRTLDWQSFHPNFFFIFNPGSLKQFSTTYITSLFMEPEQSKLLTKLSEAFPALTIIDVANIINQVQNIIAKMTIALQILFMMTLIAGMLIFIVSIQSNLKERKTTYHLLSILGASKNFIIKSIFFEFVVLLLLILFSALIFGNLISYLLLNYIFKI